MGFDVDLSSKKRVPKSHGFEEHAASSGSFGVRPTVVAITIFISLERGNDGYGGDGSGMSSHDRVLNKYWW